MTTSRNRLSHWREKSSGFSASTAPATDSTQARTWYSEVKEIQFTLRMRYRPPTKLSNQCDGHPWWSSAASTKICRDKGRDRKLLKNLKYRKCWSDLPLGMYVTIFNSYLVGNFAIPNEAFDEFFKSIEGVEIFVPTQPQEWKGSTTLRNHRWTTLRNHRWTTLRNHRWTTLHNHRWTTLYNHRWTTLRNWSSPGCHDWQWTLSPTKTTHKDVQQPPLYGPEPLSVTEGTDLRIECTTDDTSI